MQINVNLELFKLVKFELKIESGKKEKQSIETQAEKPLAIAKKSV